MNKTDFKEYINVFLEQNAKLNLISKNDEKFLWEKHIFDSLAIEKFFEKYKTSPLPLGGATHVAMSEYIQHTSPLPLREGRILNELASCKNSGKALKLLDIGTGGGFPSVPIALTHPEIDVYALDSIRKKINAIENIKEALNIQNLHTICDRAENITTSSLSLGGATHVAMSGDIQQTPPLSLGGATHVATSGDIQQTPPLPLGGATHVAMSGDIQQTPPLPLGEGRISTRGTSIRNLGEGFDIITSRAVATLDKISSYALPLLNKNGYFIAYKSIRAQEEIELAQTVLHKYRARVIDIIKYDLPLKENHTRNLIVIKMSEF